MEKDWDLGNLVKAAADRTAERFGAYIATTIIGGLLTFLLILLIGLMALVLFLIYKMTPVIAILLAIPVFVFDIVLYFYITSWVTLAQVAVLTTEPKTGFHENFLKLITFNKVKPRVWDFVKVMILTGVFLIGITPFGIFSLGIILILWSLWSFFITFVFLEQKRLGLDNLWISRSMVNQKFWEIALRLSVVYIILFLIYIVLSLSNDYMASIVSFFVSIFSTPFLISFNYQIYKNLKTPKEVEKSGFWTGLSIIGWFIMIGIIVLLIIAYISSSGRLI